MSSDEDDLDFLNFINVVNENHGKRKYWVHPFWKKNCEIRGAFSLFSELSDESRFQSFYRMKINTFNKLLQLVRPTIVKKDTNYRKAVSPEERLLITLRYYAGDSLMKALSYYFLRGETTVRNIIETTSEAIWEILQPLYIPLPTKDIWEKTAKRYEELWNLPNCIGSVDGKHISIRKPFNSGSAFYNYKKFFSIVLMVIADADGNFLAIDVGEYGRNSDARVFRESSFGQRLIQKTLDLPQLSCLHGENNKPPFPYYLVGDEAFPLLENLMRPYPRRQLTNTKRVYNYRISRGRKSVECAFGMLESKFRILSTPISRKTEKIDTMIKALCVLHNFIRIHDGVFTIPSEMLNDDNQDSNIFENEFQQNNHQLNRTRPTNTAIELRDRLCSYFIQPYAALHWKNKYTTSTE